MFEQSRELPVFDNPPVIETMLSVQFDPIPGVRTAHLGLLWGAYKHTFPKVDERVPLAPAIERFPANLSSQPEIRVEAGESFAIPRLWFISESGNELIQVQNDRFSKNWRKTGEKELYPRYESTIRPQFNRDFRRFRTFLEENSLGSPRINQCEVMYLNHIVADQGRTEFQDVAEILRFWSDPEWPTSMEGCHLLTRFVIPGSDGNPIGRLSVEFHPAIRKHNNQPMYVFRLTARGLIGDGLDFLDLGREWIVKTFESMTTRAMHQVWKRREP